MTRSLDISPRPVAPAPAPLIAIDRAIAELRRGGMVAIVDGFGGTTYVLAAEAVTAEALAQLAALAGTPPLVAVTGRRGMVLGLVSSGEGTLTLASRDGFDAETIAWLADPCARALPRPDLTVLDVTMAVPLSGAAGAVALTKAARLLPAAAMAVAAAEPAPGIFVVSAADVADYQQIAARTLTQVSQARVPLKDAENARIVAFRPADGGIEHLAIVIGEPDCEQPVLARLHSECFTGDLLGSLRCDCGDQLRGAIAEIAQAGSGVLLYLAQEGRGIGLVNKLRAYELQDDGFDTLDANLQLGFDDDERIYQPAAQMLALLGIGKVRLMTNNPLKVDALARHGIDVAERVPHVFPANDHNQGYLRTKATRGGHMF